MKLLIDLQGCQTLSRFRGIGRYSISLVRSIIANRGSNEIVLLANGALKESLGILRAEFSDFIQSDNFVVFDFESPVAEIDIANFTRARLAELARERLIESISPDAVLLTSLFEGFLDDAVTSIGSIGTKPLTAVILYDLIPYINPDPAWPSHFKKYYLGKIESLKSADILLSISDYAKSEASSAIPILANRITNISSACDDIFKPLVVDSERQKNLFIRMGIKQKFIMSCSALDVRKNFELLLRAFAELPEELRSGRQIVLVGSGDESQIQHLRKIASDIKLDQSQLILVGHISNEDLLDLYRLCELFIFPSKHEGFGLPALEAMSCGAIVLGSNTTSIPEVIGLRDAMFDPNSIESLSNLMAKVLSEEKFAERIRANGLRRAQEFSWDVTSKAALNVICEAVKSRLGSSLTESPELNSGKPCLAIVSPLPPEKTGIADYLADLLPALSDHYQVTIITDQSNFATLDEKSLFETCSVAWFEKNAHQFERVLYQFGNSPFHAHMLDLMARFPGVVVLHDFFASSLFFWMEWSGYRSNAIRESLMHSHGYEALRNLRDEGEHFAKISWPCNYDVIHNALFLIVHSEYSRDLIKKYYGLNFVNKVAVTKHHRTLLSSDAGMRSAARKRLQISEDTFLCCAFGFMDETKLNHRLLDAWASSSLASNKLAKLVFVGGEPPDPYSIQVDKMIASIDGGSSIEITGFADQDIFLSYLHAADCAVQLRTLSRGETSGTVLGCLAAGVPLITNANGSIAEYPSDILVMLPEEFTKSELVEALERMKNDPQLRVNLGALGIEYVEKCHSPMQTARDYKNIIEKVAQEDSSRKVIKAIQSFWSKVSTLLPQERQLIERRVLDLIMPIRRPKIYLDVSATARNDLKTGIERVARSLLGEMLSMFISGYQIIPVYVSEENGCWHVRRASAWLSNQEGYAYAGGEDEIIIPSPGDMLVAVDLSPDTVIPAANAGLYTYWRASGAQVSFIVYDILPITLPECFPPWASSGHMRWVNQIISNADKLICISEHVKSELLKWIDENKIPRSKSLKIYSFSLGSDIDASIPSKGIPPDSVEVLELLKARPTCLMVGTIEPRKGYLQALEVFERLWAKGIEINLVIVGKEGWKGLPNEDRRTIPKILDAITKSNQLGKYLFWLDGISDEYLEQIYEFSDVLVAASFDEGFGLPLIEAHRHGLKVLARDIPVFREVGHAYFEFFLDNEPGKDLERALEKHAIKRNATSNNANLTNANHYTWAQSAKDLMFILTGNQILSDE